MQFLDAPKLGRITTTSQKGGIMQKAFDQKKIKIVLSVSDPVLNFITRKHGRGLH